MDSLTQFERLLEITCLGKYPYIYDSSKEFLCERGFDGKEIKKIINK